jgi:hypothetical protein
MYTWKKLLKEKSQSTGHEIAPPFPQHPKQEDFIKV